MYRNISYSSYEKEITLWTWDEQGNRVTQKFPFSPFIYLEQKENATAMSIFKTPLAKREFETEYHRKKFVTSSGIRRIFYNLPPEQQFLIERYHDTKDWMSFTKYDLRTFFLDIEVYSPDEFPEASKAKHPINLITIFDSLEKKYHTWGLEKDYHTLKDNVVYTKCISEQDLLKTFLRYWRKNFPDILSGWNSDAFDIPYLVNRLNILFGENYANKLSPTDNIWSNEKIDRYKNPVTEWNIGGISCIDYMKAYQKFSRNQRESYTLDYISNYELGYGKDNHDGLTIAELADDDWYKFVDYNIKDTQLLVDLEAKLHFLELCRMLGYKGLTKFEKALGTTNVAAGILAVEAKQRNQVIPTFEHKKGHKPPGGLVREPLTGFVEDLIGYDATSLYPLTIVTLNISPETKIGNIIVGDNFTTIHTVRGKEFKLENDKFKTWMEEHKICKSMNNTLFSQTEKGLVPSLIDNIFKDRKTNKDLGKKLERQMKKLSEDSKEYKEKAKKARELDVLQYTLKILMNSIYGTFGNEHSIMYDLDIAASITLTGQEVNLQSTAAVTKYAKDKYDIDENMIIYGDTDSCYITIRPILKKIGKRLKNSDGQISPEAMEIIADLGGEDEPSKGYISKYLRKWAKKELNSLDPRFEFKREKISDVALFLDAKKTYISHNLDIEGTPISTGDEKEWSYTGGAIVSASMAKEIKKIVKAGIESMIIKKDPKIGNTLIKGIYDDFCKLEAEVLATRKAVRDLTKYEKKSNGFNIALGTPQNSKVSLLHNNLIDYLNLTKKYEKIKSGDKIKMLYVSKNNYGIECIGFKDKLPSEFGMTPNYDMLYLKNVHPIFERLYEAVGWKITNPTKSYACDIISVFE